MAEKGDWSEGVLAMVCGKASPWAIRCISPSCIAKVGEAGGAVRYTDDQLPDELAALWRLISGSLTHALSVSIAMSGSLFTNISDAPPRMSVW